MSMFGADGTRTVSVSATQKSSSKNTRDVHTDGASGRSIVDLKEGSHVAGTEDTLEVEKQTSARSIEFPDHGQRSNPTGQHSKSQPVPKVRQKNLQRECRTEQSDHGDPECVPFKGQAIILNIALNKKDVVQRSYSCTVDEYMKWQFIIHSNHHLDQLNTMICVQNNAKLDDTGLLQVFDISLSENLESLGTAVVDFALKQEGISVKHLPINSNLVDQAYKKISNAAIMQSFCHAEIIDDSVCIAYLSRNNHKVNECLRTQCGITIPCDKMNVYEVVTLNPIWKNLHKMIHLDEVLRQAVNEPDLCVDIKLASNELKCMISGPQNVIESAQSELVQLEKKVCKRHCNLCIKNVKAIAELNVLDYLDNVLYSKSLKCVVSQRKESMYVHGFSSHILEEACKVIESTIIEKPIIVTKENRDVIDVLQSAAKKDHPGLIVFHFESRQKLFVIGVKEFVNEFFSMVHKPGIQHGDSMEFVTKMKVPNKSVFKFIRSSQCVREYIAKNGIDLELIAEELLLVVELKGTQPGVNDAVLFLSNLMKNFLMENYKIDDVRAIQNLSQDTERQLLQKCITQHDVLLDMCTDHSSGFIEEISWCPSNACMRLCSWTDTMNTRCIRLMGKTQMEDNDLYCIRFKTVSHSNNPAGIKPAETNMMVGVPLWNDGCDNAIVQFDDVLAEALRTVEKDGRCEIVMLLHSSHTLDWPFKNFIHRIAKSVVRWLFSAEKIPKLHTVILLVQDDYEYKASRHTVNKIHENKMKDAVDEVKVLVVPGELNTTKADVLVNTAGKNLDLSYGKVSKSLLKAAGKAMQAECLSDYPDGLKHGEIAVTGGYNLPCDKVFHIALDRYMKTESNDMRNIQDIRKLVEDCLIKTSQYGFESIAFPAIGTGILQYPIDIVSSAMFEGVEKFKLSHSGTTIKSVLFVIYPKNEKVMEVFKKNEKILYDNLNSSKKKAKNITSVFTVSGMPDNVKATIKHLHEITDRAKNDPLEVVQITIGDVTRIVYTIWKKYYQSRLNRSQYEHTDFPYDDKVNTLIMKGRRQEVFPLVEVINSHIKEIKGSSLKQIKVPTVDVYTALERKCLKYTPGCCMHAFDYYNSMIYLCGESNHVLAIANDLKLELNVAEAETDSDGNGDSEDDKLGKASNIDPVLNKFKQSNSHSKTREQQMHFTKPKDENDSQRPQLGVNIRNSPSIDSLEKGIAGMNLSDVPGVDVGLKDKLPIHERELPTKPSVKQINGKNVKLFRFGQIVLYVYVGDILKTQVDCIVNPANGSLNHQSGLAGIIARNAGKEMAEESDDILKKKGVQKLPVTSVVLTGAGQLPYFSIMHAIGPCWYDYSLEWKHSCADDLCNTIVHCLHEAENNEYKTIALPMISSGLFGVPHVVCAAQYRIGLEKFQSITRNILQGIHFLDVRQDMVMVVQNEFAEHFPEISSSDTTFYDAVDSTMKVSTAKSDNRSQLTVKKQDERKSDEKESVVGVGDVLRDETEMEQEKMEEDTNEDHNEYKSGQTKKQFENTAHSKPRPLKNEVTLKEAALNVFGESHQKTEKNSASGRNDLEIDPNMCANQNGLEDCVICLDKVKKGKKLKCGHIFCTACIDSCFQVKPVCPTCGEVIGVVTGDQPYGTMEVSRIPTSVAGYEEYKTLRVTYNFPNGRQGPDHPAPREYYRGINRTGYIPDTAEGQEICSMLKIAFERRLIFTIGTSRTTGHQDVITWNDIHHKTNLRPYTQFGYPDETYLERVREELAAKGVCQPDKEFLKKLKNDANLTLKISSECETTV